MLHRHGVYTLGSRITVIVVKNGKHMCKGRGGVIGDITHPLTHEIKKVRKKGEKRSSSGLEIPTLS